MLKSFLTSTWVFRGLGQRTTTAAYPSLSWVAHASSKAALRARTRRSFWFRAFIVVEAVFFVGSYLVWHQMNTSQEYRYYMKQKAPSLLDGYYQLGEQFGDLKTRKYDEECWKNK